MTLPGLLWRHVVISTHRSWLPGDPRGWRSRRHRRHSSGDYKHPPPRDEHEGLHRHASASGASPVVILPGCRGVVASALVEFMAEQGWRLVVVAVAACHCHMLVELPRSRAELKRIVGDAKCKASRAIGKQMPGRVWAAGGGFEPVLTPDHYRRAYLYIRDKQGPGAWVWTHAEGMRGFGDAKGE